MSKYLKVVFFAGMAFALALPFLVKAQQYFICDKNGNKLEGPFVDQNTCKNTLFNNQDYLNSGAGCQANSCPGSANTSANSNPQSGSNPFPPVFAQPPSSNRDLPQSPNDVINLINNVLWWVSTVFWIAAAGFVFYAAFLYLTAGGDAERVKKAHKQLLWAIVAVAVALMAKGLPYFVEQFLAYH